MFQYIVKRILIFIPTLLVISLLAFGLSKLTPGDPVLSFEPDLGGNVNTPAANARAYQETAEILGLNKPLFYLSLSSKAYPDTLFRILRKEHRETVSKLISQYGNWTEIEHYYNLLGQIHNALFSLSNINITDEVRNIRAEISQLFLSYKDKPISIKLSRIVENVERDTLLTTPLKSQLQELVKAYQHIKERQSPNQLYYPDIKWYGFNNQYHHWFTNFIQGDFGISYTDGRPVFDKMKDALKWTLIINGIAILIAFLLSIPIGVYTAVYKDSWFDKVSTLTLFIFYSLPTFWIATILMIFFTTPEYGMDYFPSFGLGDLPSDAPFWDRFWETANHMILPIFCLTYTSLAFISRQMRGGMLNELDKPYIQTARAKGLSLNQVTWRHAFRNALFPIITLFASVFPAALAGSVVIEVIYNIPGMGKLTVDAIFARNWPIVYTVLMLAAIMTMVGILVSDILYAVADPRVSFDKKDR